MENNGACKGDSREQIREKLIAISEFVPGTTPDSTPALEVPACPNGAAPHSTPALEVPARPNGAAPNEDATEKLISDLISISYDESPDNIVSPESGPKANGKP